MGFYFQYCGDEAGLVVVLCEVFQEGYQAGHLFFEGIEGLVAVEDPDRFAGKDFPCVFADAAAGGACGELVDIVPFLLGEPDVEAAGTGYFGGGIFGQGKSFDEL